jgi:hypothetical protein
MHDRVHRADDALCGDQIRRASRRYARNIKRGLPIVALGVAEFQTKKYGKVLRPDFRVVGWANDHSDGETVPQPKYGNGGSSVDLNDDIPF